MPSRSLLHLSLACCLAVSGTASAQASDDEAKRLYELGSERYDQRDFASSIQSFRRAYELSKRKELLYNIGVCYRELGDLEPSLDAFRQYLAFLGPSAPNAEVVRRQIADLERLVPARLELHARERRETAITIDGMPRGAAPVSVSLPAGAHTLVAESGGRAERLSLSLTAGERRILEVGPRRRTGLWIGLGLGAGVVVATAVTLAVVLTWPPPDPHRGTLDPQVVDIR